VNSDSEIARGEIAERALVAAFSNRESAHAAAKNLHEEGFHKIWLGVTSEETTIKSEDDSLPARLGRFFKGESDGKSLVQTLALHGVGGADAQRVERQLEPNEVILTVDGSNHPELAARIIESSQGDVLSGESFVFTTVEWTAPEEVPGSVTLGYEDPNEYARGLRIDDTELTRLRSERQLTGAVPTLREELFVMHFDNEDVDDGTSSMGGAIGTRHREDIEP
jgi:hypothetical protein